MTRPTPNPAPTIHDAPDGYLGLVAWRLAAVLAWVAVAGAALAWSARWGVNPFGN